MFFGSRRTVSPPWILPSPRMRRAWCAPRVAVGARAALDPLWSMSAMTLLRFVLLSSPLLKVTRAAAVNILALAIVLPLLMLAASPVFSFFIHRQGVPNFASHDRLI